MEKKKTYVLDTTVLIYDPDIFYKLGEADIVVPLAVIKELDGLKNSDNKLVAQAARKISREIDRLGSYGDLIAGMKLPTGPVLRIYKEYVTIDELESENDNKIVGAALKIKGETGNVVKLLTTDNNMRIVARAYSINTEIFPSVAYFEKINTEVEPKNVVLSEKKNVTPKHESGTDKDRMINIIFNKIRRGVILAISLFATIVITAVPTIYFSRDMFTGIFLSVVIGSFIFMIAYSVYLRNRLKNIVSLKSQRKHFLDNRSYEPEIHQDTLFCEPWIGNPETPWRK